MDTASSRRQMADLLGVDEVLVRNTLDGYVVRLRFSGEYMETKIDTRMPAQDVGRTLGELANQLRAQVQRAAYGQVIDRKIEQVASVYGMSVDQLEGLDKYTPMTREQAVRALDDESFRCDACGHPSTMHGKDRRLACTIWGCDCMDFVYAGKPSLPERVKPMTRFEAIAEELKKL